MRLIHLNTLKLVEVSRSTPPYAILSHTWSDDEVSLQQLESGQSREQQTEGWAKLTGFCRTVRLDASSAPTWGWVDTCCIDKTSSADLSESINSMFRWYQQAACCYAILSDVEYSDDTEVLLDNFAKSRWFTRGWTLQELLAPPSVLFFDKNWTKIGSRSEMSHIISSITGIPERVLRTGKFGHTSIAERMSWASARQTTRPEDTAYSLLGIFNVYMPLLYGEGKQSFIRLQEEIIKNSEDQSIFAWDASFFANKPVRVGLLAPSPEFFAKGAIFGTISDAGSGEPTVTNKGIRIKLPFSPNAGLGLPKRCLRLACPVNGDFSSRAVIDLFEFEEIGSFSRQATAVRWEFVSPKDKQKPEEITIIKQMEIRSGNALRNIAMRGSVRFRDCKSFTYNWLASYPPQTASINSVTGSLVFLTPRNEVTTAAVGLCSVFVFQLAGPCPETTWAVELFYHQSKQSTLRILDLTDVLTATKVDRSIESVIEDLYEGSQDRYLKYWKKLPGKGVNGSAECCSVPIPGRSESLCAELSHDSQPGLQPFFYIDLSIRRRRGLFLKKKSRDEKSWFNAHRQAH
ncbi:hypothetical protein NLG97_g1446 [Lecanicillium saksenae]|uniref:Uncharacterized protein n=1 Tax=Lecanicillium saksenae TaxID=468837 RepID=A0ACC1R6C7_9HYPO|nr:hypothetical protein NLG97_g1446 [Lecanicillium saksenae]